MNDTQTELTVWRITTQRFAASAFSGEGARLYGGRWNRVGQPLVYAAQSRSLALLEILVQDEPLRANYVLIPATLGRAVSRQTIGLPDLPPDWRDLATRHQLQRIGSQWLARGESCVLVVPSAVLPGDSNYLINPIHSDFKQIKIGTPEPLDTDLRLRRDSP